MLRWRRMIRREKYISAGPGHGIKYVLTLLPFRICVCSSLCSEIKPLNVPQSPVVTASPPAKGVKHQPCLRILYISSPRSPATRQAKALVSVGQPHIRATCSRAKVQCTGASACAGRQPKTSNYSTPHIHREPGNTIPHRNLALYPATK